MTVFYRKGVGAVIINDQKEVLVANRIDTPDSWQMPQGGIDEGENPQDALFRELEEELGTNQFEIIAIAKQWLKYEFPKDIQEKVSVYWGNDCVGQEHLWFLCKLLPNAVINVETKHPEFLTTKWETPSNVKKGVIAFKEDMYKAIFKEFDYILIS